MQKSNKGIGTSAVVFGGLFVALSIILTRFLSFMPLPTIRIDFGDLPIELAGILFGPVVGGIVGVVADLVGFVIKPSGPYFFGFTISYALFGIIPGLFFIRHKGRYPLWKIALAVITANILISLLLNSFWLSLMYGKAFVVLIANRALVKTIIAAIEILFISLIINRIRLRD